MSRIMSLFQDITNSLETGDSVISNIISELNWSKSCLTSILNNNSIFVNAIFCACHSSILCKPYTVCKPHYLSQYPSLQRSRKAFPVPTLSPTAARMSFSVNSCLDVVLNFTVLISVWYQGFNLRWDSFSINQPTWAHLSELYAILHSYFTMHAVKAYRRNFPPLGAKHAANTGSNPLQTGLRWQL